MPKFQAIYDSGAIQTKTQALLAKLKARARGSNSQQLNEIIEDYYTFIEDLGRAAFDGRPLDSRETATFQRLNELFGEIDEDLKALFNEYAGLIDMYGRAFNRGQSQIKGAEADLNITTGLVLESALAAKVPQRGLFIASDVFNNTDQLDPKSTADIIIGGGALVLNRESTISAISNDTVIDINPDKSDIVVEGLNVKSNPPYEGKYYALLGEIIPEADYLKFVTDATGKTSLSPAPADALVEWRKQLIDKDPTTYWQIERTVLVSQDEVDPTKTDKYDFKLVLTIDLKKIARVGAITLDPFNFDQRAFLEINDIQISTDKQNWSTVPGLHDYNYYNVLTDEANAELNEDQANTVMAPSKFSYAGKGLWVFPETDVRYIQLTIIQKTPILQQYEVLSITREQQVTTTKKAVSIGPFKVGSDKTKTKTETQVEELSYENSLQVYSQEREPTGTAASIKSNGGVQITGILGENIFSGSGTTVEKSGWVVKEITATQKSNVLRYAIGIRDIDILSSVYSAESQYISKDFTVPSPIRQINLRAEHTIPEQFGPGNWIRYFVSLDNEGTWIELSPLDNPPKYTDNVRIPNAMLVNSMVPDQNKDPRFAYFDAPTDITKLKVKIDISRPDTATGLTPIVNRYALEILTEETTNE